MSGWWVTFQSAQVERIAKKWFSALGKVEKIPTSIVPTYDYKIDRVKLLIEVKWINSENRGTKVSPGMWVTKQLTDEDLFHKMLAKVMSLQKDASNYPSYYRGGIIFWDTIFDFLQHPLTHTNFTATFPFDYEIFDYDWQYLILCEEPSVGDRPPAFIYIKKRELIEPLKKVFEKQYYIMYVFTHDQFVAIIER